MDTYIGRLRMKVVEQAEEIRELKRKLGETPDPIDPHFFYGRPFTWSWKGYKEERCGICQVIFIDGDVCRIRSPIKPSEHPTCTVHQSCSVAPQEKTR
jgi:hypothetical protein